MSDFWTIFFQALVSGIAVGAIYGLIALGFNLIFATTRVLNFAQGEYLAIGAMVGYTMQVTLGWSLPVTLLGVVVVMVVVGAISERFIMIADRPPAPVDYAVYGILISATMGMVLDWALWVSVVSAVIATGVAALAYRYIFRSLSSGATGGFGWILTTLGAAIVMRNLLAFFYGTEPYRPPAIIDGRFMLGDVVITYQQVAIVGIAILLVILNELFARYTFFGKAIRATAFDYDIASLMGIPVGLTISLSFALSAVMTGLAGVLIAPVIFADANMGLLLGLKGFVAVVVGGLGSARGAMVGGLTVGLLEGFLRAVLPSLIQTDFNISNIIVFGLLAAMLYFRPTGILGQTVPDHH